MRTIAITTCRPIFATLAVLIGSVAVAGDLPADLVAKYQPATDSFKDCYSHCTVIGTLRREYPQSKKLLEQRYTYLAAGHSMRLDVTTTAAENMGTEVGSEMKLVATDIGSLVTYRRNSSNVFDTATEISYSDAKRRIEDGCPILSPFKAIGQGTVLDLLKLPSVRVAAVERVKRKGATYVRIRYEDGDSQNKSWFLLSPSEGWAVRQYWHSTGQGGLQKIQRGNLSYEGTHDGAALVKRIECWQEEGPQQKCVSARNCRHLQLRHRQSARLLLHRIRVLAFAVKNVRLPTVRLPLADDVMNDHDLHGRGRVVIKGSPDMAWLPVIEGVIRRRLLVNYRVDPDVVQRLLPACFRPKLYEGHAIAGVCLIRLEHIRPQGMPRFLGLASENGAHRIAVSWDDQQGETRDGVFIPRRDTDSRLNRFAGGRIFPGLHHHANFRADEAGNRIGLSMKSRDGLVTVELVGQEATTLPQSSVFRSLSDASRFFEAGSLGYSVTRDACRFEGLVLETSEWSVRPLDVSSVYSSYFADRSLFPLAPSSLTMHCSCGTLPTSGAARPICSFSPLLSISRHFQCPIDALQAGLAAEDFQAVVQAGADGLAGRRRRGRRG